MLNVKRFKSLILFQGYVSPWREKIGVKHLSKYGFHSKYTVWWYALNITMFIQLFDRRHQTQWYKWHLWTSHYTL